MHYFLKLNYLTREKKTNYLKEIDFYSLKQSSKKGEKERERKKATKPEQT